MVLLNNSNILSKDSTSTSNGSNTIGDVGGFFEDGGEDVIGILRER